MSFNPPAVEPEDPPIVIHAVVKSFRVGAQRHHDEAYTQKDHELRRRLVRPPPDDHLIARCANHHHGAAQLALQRIDVRFLKTGIACADD
jgi:hypothetical protein